MRLLYDLIPQLLAVRNKLFANLLRLLVRQVPTGLTLARLGSRYGGWIIPLELVETGSICYCAGVGEDISFDLALIDRFSCQVFAFDPTPRAVEYGEGAARLNPHYHFHSVGLWSDDTVVRFYAPRDERHASYSALNLQRTTKYVEAPCRRLSTIMRDLNHTRLDLLKIDIEGAEYVVLDSVLADELDVRLICVEFDQPMPITAVFKMIGRLRAARYIVAQIDEWNVTFIHRNAL